MGYETYKTDIERDLRLRIMLDQYGKGLMSFADTPALNLGMLPVGVEMRLGGFYFDQKQGKMKAYYGSGTEPLQMAGVLSTTMKVGQLSIKGVRDNEYKVVSNTGKHTLGMTSKTRVGFVVSKKFTRPGVRKGCTGTAHMLLHPDGSNMRVMQFMLMAGLNGYTQMDVGREFDKEKMNSAHELLFIMPNHMRVPAPARSDDKRRASGVIPPSWLGLPVGTIIKTRNGGAVQIMAKNIVSYNDHAEVLKGMPLFNGNFWIRAMDAKGMRALQAGTYSQYMYQGNDVFEVPQFLVHPNKAHDFRMDSIILPRDASTLNGFDGMMSEVEKVLEPSEILRANAFVEHTDPMDNRGGGIVVDDPYDGIDMNTIGKAIEPSDLIKDGFDDFLFGGA